MNKFFPVNKVPFTMLLGVQTNTPELMRIVAKDSRKPSSYYYYRRGMVEGNRMFELKMPQTPSILNLQVYNMKHGIMQDEQGRNTDNSFQITMLEAKPVKENPIFMTARDMEFFRFAQWFSENASYLSAEIKSPSGKIRPSIFRSQFGNFEIDYYNVIRDRADNNKILRTPARVGHLTGVIEVSKESFMGMTIPMRLIILLHEYSHKFNNPKIGREIDDEVAADINALRMYLSKGYSEVEAHYAFLKVFKGSNTALNQKRYFILKDFIDKFNNGYFDNVKTDYVTKAK